jgi:hypothetical protein
MRFPSESLSATKSKSPAGYCIAEACRFTEFVELFATFYDAGRFSGHGAKDRGH